MSAQECANDTAWSSGIGALGYGKKASPSALQLSFLMPCGLRRTSSVGCMGVANIPERANSMQLGNLWFLHRLAALINGLVENHDL